MHNAIVRKYSDYFVDKDTTISNMEDVVDGFNTFFCWDWTQFGKKKKKKKDYRKGSNGKCGTGLLNGQKSKFNVS